jgi:hypothetical protein
MKQIDLTMELFDFPVRRLQNGNKLSIIFETAENLELEKKLIEFRGDNVTVNLTQESPENESDRVNIEGIFEVFDIKCRRLRNGDKLRLVYECLYDKEQELKLVKLRYDNVKINMELIELPFEKEDDPEQIETPELELKVEGQNEFNVD